MIWRYRSRNLRRKLGCALAVLGMIVWVVSATLPIIARNVPLGDFEVRALGVIIGGAAVAGGIILFATAV
jgi:small neutral amino acid transporter SnatA (MarC family)